MRSITSAGILFLGANLSRLGFAVASIPILSVTPTCSAEGSSDEPRTLGIINRSRLA